MANSHTTRAKSKPARLIAIDNPQRSREVTERDGPLVAGGLEPTDDMSPGKFVALYHGSRPFPKFGKDSHQLLWQVDEGPHAGTALPQYVTIERFKNRVPLGTSYGRQCVIAMGGAIEPGDSLDPDSVFSGKRCLVDVGYRKTRGIGGQSDDKLKLIRKANDFLRVHQVLALVDGIE